LNTPKVIRNFEVPLFFAENMNSVFSSLKGKTLNQKQVAQIYGQIARNIQQKGSGKEKNSKKKS
jgi:hypothetical protein